MMQSRHVTDARNGKLSHLTVDRRIEKAKKHVFDPFTIGLIQRERQQGVGRLPNIITVD